MLEQENSVKNLLMTLYSGTCVLWIPRDQQKVLIFQVSLYDKAPFGTTTKSVDYAGILIFKCPD